MVNLFVAYNYEAVLHWCSTHGVDPQTIRYLNSERNSEGLGYFNIVFLDRWYDSKRYDRAFVDVTARRAINIIYGDDSIPVVKEGRIIDWKQPEKISPT